MAETTETQRQIVAQYTRMTGAHPWGMSDTLAILTHPDVIELTRRMINEADEIAAYATVKKTDLPYPSHKYDWAQDYAISAIVSTGRNSEATDDLGTEVGDELQTILMMLALRCPDIARQIHTDAEDFFSDDALVWRDSELPDPNSEV